MTSTFRKLGKFKKIDFDEACDQFDFDEALEEAELDDLFGEEPETVSVLASDVSLEGPVRLGDEDPGIWVIDGDLTVNGVLTFNALDNHNLLLVTGDLTCAGLAVSWEADLVVLGSLKCSNVFISGNSDGGQTVIHGDENEVKAVVLTNRATPRFLDEAFEPTLINGWSDQPRKGAQPRATTLLAPFSHEDNRPHEVLVEALLAGKPVLA